MRTVRPRAFERRGAADKSEGGGLDDDDDEENAAATSSALKQVMLTSYAIHFFLRFLRRKSPQLSQFLGFLKGLAKYKLSPLSRRRTAAAAAARGCNLGVQTGEEETKRRRTTTTKRRHVDKRNPTPHTGCCWSMERFSVPVRGFQERVSEDVFRFVAGDAEWSLQLLLRRPS
jgi:hypothetical protein